MDESVEAGAVAPADVDKKAALLAQTNSETRDVLLPAFGFSVTVRGLTRSEALRVAGKPMAADESERKLLALAMVDPVMTEEDVRRWQKVAPAGQLQPVELAVRELSGLVGDEVREGIAQFRE